jgi:hypothetical protein
METALRKLLTFLIALEAIVFAVVSLAASAIRSCQGIAPLSLQHKLGA